MSWLKDGSCQKDMSPKQGKNCHLDDIFGQPEGSDGGWGEERAVVLFNVYIKRLHHPESKSELKNRSSLNMKPLSPK